MIASINSLFAQVLTNQQQEKHNERELVVDDITLVGIQIFRCLLNIRKQFVVLRMISTAFLDQSSHHRFHGTESFHVHIFSRFMAVGV